MNIPGTLIRCLSIVFRKTKGLDLTPELFCLQPYLMFLWLLKPHPKCEAREVSGGLAGESLYLGGLTITLRARGSHGGLLNRWQMDWTTERVETCPPVSRLLKNVIWPATIYGEPSNEKGRSLLSRSPQPSHSAVAGAAAYRQADM